jgi:uncharacterized protein (DUF1684 family)
MRAGTAIGGGAARSGRAAIGGRVAAAALAVALAAAAVLAAAATAEVERRDKETYFRDNAWSPLRAFARYDFAPRAAGGPEPSVVVGSAPDAGVRLDGPGVLPRHMRLTVLSPAGADGPWRFRIERLAPQAVIRIGGKEWGAAPAAAADPAGSHPAAGGEADGEARVVDEDTVVEAGPFALRPYVQADTGILVEFDRRRTEGRAFIPPAWYPVSSDWVFRAPLVRFDTPETVGFPTSLGRRKEYVRVGYFEIEPPGEAGAGGDGATGRDGAAGSAAANAGSPARVRVIAYRPTFIAQEKDSVSILFTDRTTGDETYAAGRYLDLGPPENGVYTLDFNRAYNPLCAYTDVYNCPIPPQENALTIAVKAGERTWPGRAHH